MHNHRIAHVRQGDPFTNGCRSERFSGEKHLEQELPIHFREIVLLCDVEEMTYQELAATLNIPIGTVMSRLFYARRKLAALLADLRKEKQP